MEIESDKTIFMGMAKPSDKCLLVSIPMSMYRIQTNKFTSGLNYFQKAVLKLKYMPQMSNVKIATLLHLDEHLINLIVDQLESKGLLLSTGFLTPEGEELRNNADGFIIDESHSQIGYVFSYDDGNELFPYYQKEVNFAEISNNELIYNTDKGTKSVEAPLSIIESINSLGLHPSEEEILQVIKNSAYRDMDGDGDVEDITQQMFSIKYIPNDKPEPVMVCTYIYLPQGDNGYDDDWLVLDPFGNGNNYELKLYLEKEKKINKQFAALLFNTFKDAVTENNRKFDESVKWFEEQVQERISILFDVDDFQKMDSNIQQSIHEVVDYYMRMERNEFKSISHAQKQMFFMNMQTAIESILIQDQTDREDIYADLDNNYGEYAAQEDRQQCLRAVYRRRILSDATFVPKVLLNKKTKNWKGRSLLDYLMKFIMSLSCEPDLENCKVIQVFKNRIDTIVGITEMRNHVGHGTTEAQERDSEFTGNDAIEYFNFMTGLIKDYIKTLK
jgi:hypothetical protein